MFLIGNTLTTRTVGKIVRGDLQPGGLRLWTVVTQTDTYPQSRTAFDHGLSGLIFNPAKDSLYFNSGARTDHGEIQTNGGLFPGTRDVPLTACIFRIPATAVNLTLPDDSAALAPYVFARGTRNSFKLGFTADGDLIGLENAGDRDDPEELNWLREGHHYGFPWLVGGDLNPQQFAGYDPSMDPFINQLQNSYMKGYFHNDSTFPLPPAGVTPPAINYGPDCDKFRDTSDFLVKDASDLGIPLGTFTPHRVPVGMVMDFDSILINDFKGDAFILGFNNEGDSTGFSPNGFGTLLDTSEDLVHVKLVKNLTIDNYEIYCNRIVTGFHRPVDNCMIANKIYLVENTRSNQDTANLWEIILPVPTTTLNEKEAYTVNSYCFPDPADNFIVLSYSLPRKENATLVLNNALGKTLLTDKLSSVVKSKRIDISEIKSGIYFYRIIQSGSMISAGKFIVNKVR